MNLLQTYLSNQVSTLSKKMICPTSKTRIQSQIIQKVQIEAVEVSVAKVPLKKPFLIILRLQKSLI